LNPTADCGVLARISIEVGQPPGYEGAGGLPFFRQTRGEPGVKRGKGRKVAILLVAVLAVGASAAGCAREDVKQEVVAAVNGEDIRVVDLRERMGVPAGVYAVTDIPVEKKKEGLDRLVAGRLLAQEGRSRGLDNTPEFKEIFHQNEQGALIGALLRREIEAKVKIDDGDKEVQAEVARLKEAKGAESDADILARAKRKVAETRIRKLQEELLATARKETGATLDNAMIGRIGKGESVPDNAVLGTAGDEKVLYADVKKALKELAKGGGPPGAPDLSKDPVMIANVADRELIGKSLSAYAKKQGVPGSDGYKTARKDLERNILIGMVADNVLAKGVTVTDKEIEAAYKEHEKSMVQNGKKVPLAAVKGQIRDFLQNDKRRKALDAYIVELKAKAKITVNDAVLAKV